MMTVFGLHSWRFDFGKLIVFIMIAFNHLDVELIEICLRLGLLHCSYLSLPF